MKTILVLDDEKVIRSLVGLMLRTHLLGCEVLEASDGAQGVEILARRRVDLIVTDLNMPELDGFCVIEEARRLQPLVPVYVMTGYCAPEDRDRLRRLGVIHFFEKPFSFELMTESAADELDLPARPRSFPAVSSKALHASIRA